MKLCKKCDQPFEIILPSRYQVYCDNCRFINCVACGKRCRLTSQQINYSTWGKYCSNKCQFANKPRKLRSGYWSIFVPEHPKSEDGYYCEHIIIMEQLIKRYLKNDEVVHHKGQSLRAKATELETWSLGVMAPGVRTVLD